MTVFGIIEEQLKKNPHKKIISFKDNELSFQQFKTEYEKMAFYLNHSGIKKGDIVGLCINRSLEMVTALVAIIKCGATYLPIDPVFPAQRIKLMLDDSKCNFLVSEKMLFNSFDNFSGKLIDINQYNELSNYNELPDFSDENDIAYIIYTSGSTGTPKGVQITHKSLTNLLLFMKKLPGLSDRDSLLAISTLSFDISLVELLLPLIISAKLVIASKEEVRDGQILLQKLKNKITVFQATPATWKMLINTGWNEKLNIKAISTGESLPRDLADSILERVDTLWNMYGPTETTIFSSGGQVEVDGIIHLGRPIDNTQFYIVDKNNQLCAPGVPGELLIGGAGLSPGYINKEELTKERFISNPFDKSDNSKVYKTGDLVRLTFDKKIEFLGRMDNQIKIRGYRIEPGEIEVEIKKHTFIKDCVVVVKEFAQMDKRIVAFFIPNEVPEISSVNDTEEHVSRWRNSYDNMYENAISNLSKKENNNLEIGYLVVKQFEHDNSFRDQFNVWINETTKRIRELNPQKVLEIGCGGGDILKRILPECRFYCATDLSPKVIEFLKNDLTNFEKGNAELRLYTLPADADLPFSANYFDTVIMNSVVAYLPNEKYLSEVIKKLVSYLNENGGFFIGDVQSFSLMKNLYLFEQLSRIPKSLKIGEFKQIVSNKLRTTPEFFVDPDYFYALAEKNQKIKRVEIKLMRGLISNDPAIYHYDVLFFTEKKKISDNIRTINWGSAEVNLEKILQSLNENKPEILYVEDIPNKRICIRKEIEFAIDNAHDDSLVSEVIDSIYFKNNDIDPEEIWKMETNLNYKIDLILPENGDQTRFDAVFISKDIENKLTYPVRKISGRNNNSDKYYNQPYLRLSNEDITKKIKESLSLKLPEYMRPSFYIPINSFPITPTGKVDRKALSIYDISDVALIKKSSRPATNTEKKLADIWENLLGIREVGIDDNFFELGGHSILAAQMFADIEKETGKKIPIATLFKLQTIRELAQFIDEPEWTGDWSPVIEIKKGNNGSPLFLIHGAEGNILMYRELGQHLNNDQALYGIQSTGLDGKGIISSYSIEEMSKNYIRAIKSVQPKGPYYLGGYCMGGTIAYEMAQQLGAQGDKVDLLLLLETYNICISPLVDSPSDKMKLFLENIRFHIDNLLSLRGSDRAAFFRSKWKVAWNRALVKSRYLKQKLLLLFPGNNYKSEQMLSATAANHSAHNKYKPLPYSGKTILFKPLRNFSAESDPDFGWRKLIKGEFKVYNLDLAPRGMLVEPYVIETAAIITKELGVKNQDTKRIQKDKSEVVSVSPNDLKL